MIVCLKLHKKKADIFRIKKFDQYAMLQFCSQITLKGAKELKAECWSLLLILSQRYSSCLSAVIFDSKRTTALS